MNDYESLWMFAIFHSRDANVHECSWNNEFSWISANFHGTQLWSSGKYCIIIFWLFEV